MPDGLDLAPETGEGDKEEDEETGRTRRRSMFLGRAAGPRDREKGTIWVQAGHRRASGRA